MDTFTQAMLLVAYIYNSEDGKAFLPDNLNEDSSMQDHLAYANSQGLVTIDEEYIYLTSKGDEVMQTLGLPMKHVTTKIVDAIQFIIGGLIQDADKETLKQMDRMQHMVSQAIFHNRENYSNEPK